jgi:hypothetical protein
VKQCAAQAKHPLAALILDLPARRDCFIHIGYSLDSKMFEGPAIKEDLLQDKKHRSLGLVIAETRI